MLCDCGTAIADDAFGCASCGADRLRHHRLAKIQNRQHAWDNTVVLIVGIRHRFYRVEFNGQRTWVPQEWVRIIDE